MTLETLSADELFALPGLVSEEEQAIVKTVKDFGETHLRPHIAQWFEAGQLPVRELAQQFGALGVFGMHLTGYGCAGISAMSYGLVCHELEAVDSGLRSYISVQGSLAMYAIYAFGDEEQKQQWLPGMAKGEILGCFGLTEPDFGSNPAGMRTTARRDGTDWVLNGTKMWITNAPVADVAVVWAQTGSTAKEIRGFIVPTATPGFSAPEIKKKLSLRASVTGEIILDNVRLPAESILPNVTGLRGPLSCLNEARFGIIFGAAGAARECIETVLAYTATREIFGKPLAGYQLSQAKIADMAVEYGKSMLLALHLGRLKDAGEIKPEQISLGKLNNVREAIEIARTSRTLLGANGITLDYPILRHANNLESVLTYEGTSEMHQLMIGKALTGADAFR